MQYGEKGWPINRQSGFCIEGSVNIRAGQSVRLVRQSGGRTIGERALLGSYDIESRNTHAQIFLVALHQQHLNTSRHLCWLIVRDVAIENYLFPVSVSFCMPRSLTTRQWREYAQRLHAGYALQLERLQSPMHRATQQEEDSEGGKRKRNGVGQDRNDGRKSFQHQVPICAVYPI